MAEKKREDSWQDSDDKTLAETVLSHIKSKSTQLAAFDDAAKILGRTSAACGFRWNSEIRKRYEKEVKEAKLMRSKTKNEKTVPEKKERYVSKSNDLNDGPLSFDEAMSRIISIANELLRSYESLVEENRKLKIEVKDLRKQIESSKSTQPLAQEEFQAFMQIMQRAKRLSNIEA
ncbi:hypothetical protein [Paenibacillus aestuarii]|uniref:RsfA family transcriptional regulator n=1 Tax=Paenibacillus aestuarii TaxID=516965 RepID=A0ABW0KEJ9_9BACL|nr:hypothetical protein [Paenibacillus aestuarii]